MAYPPFAGVLLYLAYCAFGNAGLSWFCALACLAVEAYLVRRGDIGSAILAMLAVQSIAAPHNSETSNRQMDKCSMLPRPGNVPPSCKSRTPLVEIRICVQSRSDS
jgi:hypothetical protein